MFGEYARWYDAFNQDKDYAAETRYVVERASRHATAMRSWLDLGCGVGGHLVHLAAHGLEVEGADQSEVMIRQARDRLPGVPLHVGAMQDLRLARRFDVVSMLFHVLSYQVSDDLAQRAMNTAAAHLAPGGVFAFDFWHTAGVRHDPPTSRVRRIEIDGRPLFRVSHPTEGLAQHRIDVRFDFRWDTPSGPLAHEEVHSMRHFAVEELHEFARNAGLRLVRCEGWMQGRALANHDWYGLACVQSVT